MYLAVQLTICSNIDSDICLVPVRQQVITWTNEGLVYWPIYASLGHSGLILCTAQNSKDWKYPLFSQLFYFAHYLSVNVNR